SAAFSSLSCGSAPHAAARAAPPRAIVASAAVLSGTYALDTVVARVWFTVGATMYLKFRRAATRASRRTERYGWWRWRRHAEGRAGPGLSRGSGAERSPGDGGERPAYRARSPRPR